MTCKARTIGQDRYCYHCEYVWDMNDPEPPVCMDLQEYGNMHLKKMKDMVKPTPRYVPDFISNPFGWYIWDKKLGKVVSDLYDDRDEIVTKCREMNKGWLLNENLRADSGNVA